MGIMLVYDITNAKTFDNISKWLRNIDEVGTLFPFILEISKQVYPLYKINGNMWDMMQYGFCV